LLQVLSEEAVSPGRLLPKLPRDLETICLKCLQKNPGQRYGSAAALAEDLRRLLEGRPITARPVGVVGRSWRWCRRNPAATTAGGALLTVAVLCALFGLSAWHDADLLGAANERLRQAKYQEEEARSAAESQRDEVRRNLYFSHMHLAKRAWDDADMVLLLDLLRQHRPGTGGGDPDLRGWEWYYLWRLCHSEPLTLRGHTDAVSSVCFSPDGRRLASASHDRTVKVWEAQTGQEVLSLQGLPGWVTGVCFSPDGRRLASASPDRTVKVWEAQTGQEQLTLKGHTKEVLSVCFSPDGRRLASAAGERDQGEVKVWDAQTGQEQLTLRGHTTAVLDVCFSPDGRRLASADGDGVKVWDAVTGREQRTLRGHTDLVLSVCFSPDGRRLASASADRTVKVWEARTGQEQLTLRGHTVWVFGVCWRPDGRRLASASGDTTVKVWDAQTGREQHTLRGHTDAVRSVCFSPDGKRLASAASDNTVKVWDAEKDQEALSLRGHAGKVWTLSWSPDGKRLASAGGGLVDEQRTVWPGEVKVWDAATGRGRPGPSRATPARSGACAGARTAAASPAPARTRR
jgi:WD40 repeat protein